MITVHYGKYPCLHHTEEIKKATDDVLQHEPGFSIVRITGSEHYILRLLRAVRLGDLSADDLQLYCEGRRIRVDVKGEFIEPWPDDLFEADFYLRFDCE